MNRVRLASALSIVALAALGCSDDDSGDAVSTNNPNQPSAGGSAGSAGSGAGGNGGSAGTGGATTAGTGGSSSETPDDDIDLDDPDDDGENGGDDDGADASAPPADGADAGGGDDTTMSFFVTSRGGPNGGNLGGLAGADALCTTLAAAVSPALGAKTWAAYLSTTTVNARDRIGSGPWFNAAGVLVATDVEQLTDADALEATWATGDASIALDELGTPVPAGGGGGGGVQHDIVTGTLADGTLAAGLTCGDWTLTTGNVQVGHSNRMGGGADPTSWSSAHTVGCAPAGTAGANITSGGGRGSIYCFEVN